MEKTENEKIKKLTEACLNCISKPCSKKGCPLNNDIPTVINLVKQEKYEDAYKLITNTTVLPSICGRICPFERQCQGSCVKGIKGEPVQISKIETFVGDMAIEKKWPINKNTKLYLDKQVDANEYRIKVAVVGGGPAGLTAAAFLAKNGIDVTIYEKYNYLGGILVHGIPEFRLEKQIVKKSIEKILDLGINVKYNQELGKNLSLEDLRKEYNKIILAFGANISSKIGINGENLKGVYGGNELLEKNLHPDYKGKTVIVNGGGNVAMDTARTVKRMGAERVIVTYRRGREQMPADNREVEEAIKDGVEFLFQTNIVKIFGDNLKKVSEIELVKTKLIKKEGDNRLSPVDIENSNFNLKCDYVMMAIGSMAEEFVKNLNLELDNRGFIKTDENGQTSQEDVYAIGDLSNNISTVAWAARSGRDVAERIVGFERGENIENNR